MTQREEREQLDHHSLGGKKVQINDRSPLALRRRNPVEGERIRDNFRPSFQFTFFTHPNVVSHFSRVLVYPTSGKGVYGGDYGTRTCDLMRVKHAL